MLGSTGARDDLTEGEVWARDALAALATQRWRPEAVAGFLGESLRRAALRREQRPQLARQARAWGAVGAAAWIVPAAAGVEPLRSRLVPGLAGWAATMVMLDWHLGMFETPDGVPMALGPPDALTLARVWMAPLAAQRPSPLLVGAALASDGLDGALARRRGPTRAGRDLEGVADVAFAAAALRGALRCGALPPAAAALEGVRIVAGVAFAAGAYFREARPPSPALQRAARGTTPLRAAGLAAAGMGHRRAAGVLVGAGALAGIAASVRAGRAPPPI